MLKRSRPTHQAEPTPEEDFLVELETSEDDVSVSSTKDPSTVVDLEAIKKLGELKLKEAEKDPLGLGHDPGSDSSEDDQPNRNTVGNVPLKWYAHEEHFGYDVDGKKLEKSARKDRLDRLIERMDKDGLVTSFHDQYNDQEVELSRGDLRMLLNIKKGKFPDSNVDPYEEYPDWFTSKTRIHPLTNALRKKSSFLPSLHEEKKVSALVQAIKSGRLKKADRKKKDPDAPRLIWSEDGRYEREGNRFAYLQPPKKPLPGHEESFNPPSEYLPTKTERKKIEERNELYKEDEYPRFIPQGFESLRKVPGYERYAREVFERCLDLFMCPRTKSKMKSQLTDPKQFFPDLPLPKDLQPFPTTLYIKYTGHQGKVRSVSVDPTGQWLASGGDDGQLRVWEILTGRCVFFKDFQTPVSKVDWHPHLKLVLIAVGKRASLIPIFDKDSTTMKNLLKVVRSDSREETVSLNEWKAREDGYGVDIEHSWIVSNGAWHSQGDYFATVQSQAGTKSVIVHRLSHKASQCPFKKNHGPMVQVGFHPLKPYFVVMAEDRLRIYDLTKQRLIKKLIPKRKGAMTCFDIHPGGDNILVGGEDNKISWYDLELSTRPYKSLKFHKHAVRGICFHQSYPLFASASDDCSVQIFHGMVYDDLNMNALIVPVKILRGHTYTDSSGVLDCEFHPNQPWIFTAGGDGNIHLYCN